MKNETVIRPAREEDASVLLEIYAPYVEKTAVTFEYEIPTPEEFTARIRRTLERYPYLVAEVDGQIAGYAYAGAFRSRRAYDWAVETSLYVRQDSRRRGIGAALYRALEESLRKQGVLNVNACVACPQGEEDEYLTRRSLAFHHAQGYRTVGEFQRCACKFGRWYNMVWMEKQLGEHLPCPAPIRPFPEIRSAQS